MRLETVVIKTKNGDVVINKADFDSKKHKLSAPKKVTKKRAAKKA